MANTINDLYLKYVNRVGKSLENDRYFQYLFEMVQAGQNTLQQTHRVLHKVVDERWLTTIEESLDALNRITEHPRRFVTSNEEVVPVELARKITADSVRHLSQNTQFIASSKNGEIHPTRILNVTTEETYNLYENRFVYHLIQRLVTFIDKRTDIIFWSTGDETCNTLQLQSSVDDAYEQIEYKLEMKIKNRQSFAENDSDNMQVFMRIDRVRRMVMALRNSSFCDIMSGCARVRSPIQRTNVITKDPDYRTCLRLWQFLESYEEVGYTIDARDTALEFDEEYLLQMYSNLITNYAVFKSLLEADPRKLEEIPPKKHKVIKPKFIKQIQEEIVDDYDIPDVEIRKVIIEEVTQAQLDAEAKLAQETELRQQAEAAREDAEKALKEYRWQADFQLAETERQAEDRVNRAKADAQAAQEAAAAALAQEKAQAAATLEKEQAQAAAREQELCQRLAARETEAAQAAADFTAQLKQARQEAAQKLNQAAQAATGRERELLAQMEQFKQGAQARLEKAKEESANREAALVNRVESAKRRAKESINYAHGQQREMAAALKAAQAALEQAKQERDSAMARERLAQERADQEAAARQRLEKKLAGSRRRLFGGKQEAHQEGDTNA